MQCPSDTNGSLAILRLQQGRLGERRGDGLKRRGVMTQTFWDRGYAIIEDLIDPSLVGFVSTAMDLSKANGLIKDRGARYIKKAEDEYSPVLGELILKQCQARIEEAVGRDLLRAYAYWRVYYEGADLVPHTDRKASEIAVSISIASDPAGQNWPIMVEDFGGNEVVADLKPGDGIIYLGRDVSHWREELKAKSHKQLMLFYVLKDGDYQEYVFDRREGDPVAGDAV